jgi:3-oxoacyl-[acyl-carrier-protein] synthase III
VIYSRIVGTGSYLPDKCVTNNDLAAQMDTSDDWIVARTGIRQRYLAAPEQRTSDLATEAARRAMAAAGVGPEEVDLVIVATSTPDMVFPATACIVQDKLGIAGGAAFDMQAVCTGFVYALATADKFIRSGAHQCALVIGAEVFSRILDWNDRSTCVLFGDGAGAVVLKASDTPGILSSHLHADGSHRHILETPGHVANGQVTGTPFLKMEGGAVFKLAVKVLEDVAHEALTANDLTVQDIDWLIAHQANIRILSHTAKKLGLPEQKLVVTVDRHANTSAASIPLALDTAVRDGRIQPGHHLLIEGVGGGFTWGSVLLKW